MAGGLSERLAFLLELDAAGAIRSARQFGDVAEREMGKADRSMSRVGTSMQVAGAGALAFAGVAGTALAGFARASEEAEAQGRKLDQGLANNASAAALGRQHFVDLADSLQDTTTAEGDAVVGLEGFLATLGRTGGEITQLTPLIVDLATRYGLDFEAAGRLVNNAVEGNTARLQRLIGPMSETESVAEALTRTVGGFAEREAQSFSGQLEIMKNNLGDVTEGIGAGVVGALNDAAGPLSGFINRLAETNPKLLETGGRIGAIATAGVGAIGGLSFLGGTVAKLADRFTTTTMVGGELTRSLNTLGKSATVIGALAIGGSIILGLKAMHDEMERLHVDIDEFSQLSDGALDNLITDGALAKMEHFGTSVDEIARALAEQSVPAAERFAEALERQGQSAESARAIIEEKRQTDIQSAADQEQYNASIERGTNAMGELGPAIADVNDRLEQNAQRNQEARDAQQALVDGTLGAIDANRQLEDSMLGTNDAIAAYNTAVATSGANSREAGDALREADDAARGLAAAADEAARKNAELNHEQYTATDSAATQIAALQSVAAGLAEGSPLRVRLQGYIAELQRAAGTFTATIETVYSAPRGNVPAGQTPVQRRARGGPVEKDQAYLVGDKYGLQNAELFVPNRDGYIVPDVSTTKGTPVGGGAAWDDSRLARLLEAIFGAVSTVAANTTPQVPAYKFAGMDARAAQAVARASK